MADITMPQLGETVTEGTITKWFKQVGDTIAEDEPLFEVSTDKVDSEVPSPLSGTLVEIKVPEGDTVDVGVVLAVIGDAGDAPLRRGRPAEDGPAAEAPARRRSSAEARAAEPSRRPPSPLAAPPPRSLPRWPHPPRLPRQRRRRSPPVAGGAPAHLRARARPRSISSAPASVGASPATTCWPPPRAARGGAPAAAPLRRRPRRVDAPACAGAPRALRRPRHGDPAQQHPQAHRRAHAPVARHVGPRLRVDRGRLRRRRARPPGPQGRSGRPRRASASPTSRSSPGPSSTPSPSSPRSTPRSPTRP